MITKMHWQTVYTHTRRSSLIRFNTVCDFAKHFVDQLHKSYTMVCPPVGGDNPRALAFIPPSLM